MFKYDTCNSSFSILFFVVMIVALLNWPGLTSISLKK